MTKINRRQALALATAAGVVPLALAPAWAAYPEKPVRMIIPIAPGGQTDIVARLLQQTIDKKKLLAKPIVATKSPGVTGAVESFRNAVAIAPTRSHTSR